MNWANRLTIGRLLLTVVFVAIMGAEIPFARSLALLLFIVASITDYVDGWIARRYQLITNFGKLMDPLVDKVMMAAAFTLLIPPGAIPAWVVILIVTREFLVTGLRLLALNSGRVLAAEALGKHKTAWQITTVIVLLLLLALPEWAPGIENTAAIRLCWRFLAPALIAIAAIFTVWSGLAYAWKNQHIIRE